MHFNKTTPVIINDRILHFEMQLFSNLHYFHELAHCSVWSNNHLTNSRILLMTHSHDLHDLMKRRIATLRQEATKLSRQAGASMDYRTRNHLRQLSHESKRKADFLQARFDKLFQPHFDPLEQGIGS